MVYLTCNGYTVIHEGKHTDDAPAECRRLELERDDGYAVIASESGRIVADAESWWTRPGHGSPPYDAATATGMYDRD